jgi:hypothetical protein
MVTAQPPRKRLIASLIILAVTFYKLIWGTHYPHRDVHYLKPSNDVPMAARVTPPPAANYSPPLSSYTIGPRSGQ